MKRFWNWVLARARVPATWVGLSIVAIVIGMEPMQAQRLADAVSMIVIDGYDKMSGDSADRVSGEKSDEPAEPASEAEDGDASGALVIASGDTRPARGGDSL